MQENLSEIVFASSDTAESRRISRWLKSGLIRRLAPRVYTSNAQDGDAVIVSRNLFPILNRLYPVALLSHRTALDAGPTEDGDLFLTYKYSKKVELPGVCVHLLKGLGPLEGDRPFLDSLYISSRPRAFLECLQISRPRSGPSKALAPMVIESRLDDICRIQGAEALNRIRDEARGVSEELQMAREFEKLSAMISAILRTRPTRQLSPPQARARSRGVPYDPVRLAIFNRLLSHLARSTMAVRPQAQLSDNEANVFAFFEAYFSNYVEGTEFEVSEAYDIVFRNRIPDTRPQDAHDVVGTYRIVSNRQEMQRVPESYDEFLDILKARHRSVMEGRPEKLPGELKQRPNRAGETHFVEPELVRGTLSSGFDLCGATEPGLPRAVFMMFLVAEVHPFEDGNGRVARIMMNAELARAGLCRIILPTVLRDDYLLALRALSRSDNPEPLCKVLDTIQQFSSALDVSSYDNAVQQLAESNAFKESTEARLRMPDEEG